MILLDNKADTLPCGLIGTPFEAVYKALRIVAADVWAVDPTVYRAGMAWGWYALHRPEKLVGFRDVVAAALVSAFAPLIKDTQTDAELAEYLRQWREYTPTFGCLQALYALFGATVDIQPITDPESQAVIPVEDTRLAFYVRITGVDFSRPLSLDDAREIALRATPLGSRPYVYYALESRVQLPVAAIPQAPEVFVENWEVATPAAPPVPLGDFILVDSSGNVVYSVENLTEIEFTPTGYFTIDEGNEVVFVEQSPFPVVCIDEGTRTPESIAPDASFDTELPYYASKLYIVTTDDGQEETLYGWECGEEPVVYEEITLYYAADSSARTCQGSITSNYTGEPQEAYLKQLYTQSGTTSALYLAVYDPEKRYERGHYNSTTGEWEPYSMQSLSDMPDTTDNPYKANIIVCNKFSLVNNWYVTNYPGSASTIRSTATYSIFRLYKLTPGIDYVYVDAILYCKASKSVANFNDDDHWYSYMGEDTAETLQSFGVTINLDNNGKAIAAGNIGIGSGKFSFKIIALYSDDGITEIETDLSNFYMNPRSSYSYDTKLYIMSKAAFNGVCAYKCRVIKKLTVH